MIARSHIPQLWGIVTRYVPSVRLADLFRELRRSAAYTSNKSFRSTVEALIQHGFAKPEEVGR